MGDRHLSLEKFIELGWQEHANHPAKVAARLEEGIKLLTKSEEIMPLVKLATHVWGNHLGEWTKAQLLLAKIESLPLASQIPLTIPKDILSLCAGTIAKPTVETASKIVQVYAEAAGALVEHDLPRASTYLDLALKHAVSLEPADPANRALAVAGNNLACSLEEKSPLTREQTDFMLSAAHAARKFWEIAGTWTHVERAEYRLGSAHLRAGNLKEAKRHAELCLAICEANQAPALEFFFAYELLTKVAKASTQAQFAALSAEDQSWCRGSLEKL